MSAPVESVAIALPRGAAVARPAAVPAPARRRRAKERGELWIIPFALTLGGSLALFAEQIAQYTTLL